MLGLNLALSLWTSIKSWLPSAWFTNNEQGVWYDPSDFSTMFQDSAGTTPVTAVEQPVGLLLDKSKGLVLGPELVTNGGFDSGTGWTLAGYATISGGLLNVGTSAAGAFATTTASVVSGRTYRCSFTLNVISGSNSVSINAGGTIGGIYTASGTYTEYLVAGATGTVVMQGRSAGVTNCTIDNISVRELSGNHATQATSTKRPTLSARVNLLTNSVWAGGTSGTLGSGAVAPTNWVFLVGTGQVTYSDQSIRFVATAQRPAIGFTYTFPVGVFAIQVTVLAGTTVVNEVLKTVGATATLTQTWKKNGVTALGTDVAIAGDVITELVTVTVAGTAVIRAGLGSTAAATGDVTLAYPQFETGSTATRYQAITTASSYDTVGFPHYLKFDGVDDALSTGSIDFTATDKMTVVVGVRKLSDAAVGTVAELSVSAAANVGVFLLRAPHTAAATYAVFSGGSSLSQNASATSFASPTSNVLTQIAGISQDINTLRINGAQHSVSATDQGTGNFGNYPLYIGSRGGTSLPFNGHLYSLIVRGAQSTDAQIVSAETYVAAKTGVSL